MYFKSRSQGFFRLWRLTVLPVLVALFAAHAQGAVKPSAKQTLTIAISGETLVYLPLYVARAGKFFEKEGITVDWVNVGAASRQTPAVMGGSADVTPLSLFHMVGAEQKGLKLIAISNLMDATALQVTLTNAAVKKTGIKPSMSVEEKLQRLKGLTIGISAPGSGTATIFRKMLIARGMQPDTWLTLTPVGGAAPSLAAFEQGLVDGVVYPAPVPEIIENKGIGKTVIDGFKEKIAEVSGVPYLVLATSQETLKKKPELIAGAIRALANAMAFAHNNPSKIPALIRPYFKNTDDAIYSKMVESYRKASAISPYITPQQVENTEKWMSIGTGQSISVKYESVVSAEPAKTISSKMSIH